jgi:hypothetical protein
MNRFQDGNARLTLAWAACSRAVLAAGASPRRAARAASISSLRTSTSACGWRRTSAAMTSDPGASTLSRADSSETLARTVERRTTR